MQIKVLWLTPFLPFPLDSGGNTRTFHLLKHLSAQGIAVTLGIVSAEKPASDLIRALQTYLPQIDVIHFEHPNQPCVKAWYFLCNFARLDRYFCYQKTKRAIAEYVRQATIDIVHIDFSQIARFLPPTLTVPAVLCYVELRYRVVESERDHQGITPKRLPLAWKAWIFRREELSNSRYFQRILCVSAADKNYLLGRKPGLLVDVVENGVDTNEYAFNPPPKAISGSYFLGWFTNQQNCIALDFFLDTIWPKVRAYVPEFMVIGRDLDSARQARLSREGIRHIAFLAPTELRAATHGKALVVPLRSGSGTRLKILEAMAMGNPVISTSIGAEGLPVTHEKDILIADDADTFAKYLLRLSQDNELPSRLAMAARKLVEQFDWRNQAAKVLHVYSSLLPKRPAEIL